ncbi:hypothetical protein EV356DRAFT_516650 [Viridothelium virens]|uniref:VPS37 C-terminal domain-containing protein n=1 Tax=Viridothelium virens TaxID=1048519 RepID=A0A6A6H5Q7_VIRVR|nr:hypothetical protein EV356DRAFT_516650 [Viridothelium virens]
MSQTPQHSRPQSTYDLPAPPPPPPPKPSAHSSGHGTPLSGPPLPPPPPGQITQQYHEPNAEAYAMQPGQAHLQAGHTEAPPLPPPEHGWLPDTLKDKSTTDLQHILSHPPLQSALVHSPQTRHPSIPHSLSPLHALLATNTSLATSLEQLESQLRHQRTATQARLLALRAQEQQYRAKIAETEAALCDFSPPALYQRLGAAGQEQEALCRTVVESFVESGGGEERAGGGGGGAGGEVASERDVAEFVKRIREARKMAFLRKERKERWDEGRVGGWR